MTKGKSIVVWFGQKWRMDEGETVNSIIRQVRGGEIMFNAPDYIKITDANQRSLTKVKKYK